MGAIVAYMPLAVLLKTAWNTATAKRPATELWGGIAAGLVALPSAIAFGIAIYAPLGSAFAARGAQAGMIGAIALGLIAPLIGRTPSLIPAPCAPAAAVLGSLATELVGRGGGSTQAISAGQVCTLLALVGLSTGFLQLVYGALGGGRLIKYIPYPVVAGYLSAVGMLILLGQLPNLLGLTKGIGLVQGLMTPALWQWPALAVGAVTMAGMGMGNRVTRLVPSPIIGLAGGLVTYYAIGMLDPRLLSLSHNPLLVGMVAGDSVGGGASSPTLASLISVARDEWRTVCSAALTLSVLLSIDTLKTCVAVDTLTRTRHDSNRELLGQGVGNFVSAIAGGVPGSATMGATLVNLNSGGTTRVSSLTAGLFALVMFIAFKQAVGWLPLSALAGILVLVSLRMFDRTSLQLLRHRSTILDFLVIAAVVVAAVLSNLVVAAGAGVGLAILLYLREQMHGSVIRRKVYGSQLSSKHHRLPRERELLSSTGKATTICELQGTMFFGTTDRLMTELGMDLKSTRFLILDMRRVQSVDFTAAHLLDQIETSLRLRNGWLILSSLPSNLPTGRNLRAYFDQLGLMKNRGNVEVFDTLDEALEWCEDRLLDEAHLLTGPDETPLTLEGIELLREFDRSTLDAIASCINDKSLRAGEVLFRAGECGDELYLVRSGSVRVTLPLEHAGHLALATFARGDFFGEVAFLDRNVRSADAVAVNQCELYVLSRARFNELSRAHPVLGVIVFARLARALAVRLRQINGELRALQDA